MNGVDLTISVPGFGNIVAELTGICDCNCTNNPVRNYVSLLFVIILTLFVLDD